MIKRQYSKSLALHQTDDIEKNIGHNLSNKMVVEIMGGAVLGGLLYATIPSFLGTKVSSNMKMGLGVLIPAVVGAVVNSPAMVAAPLAISSATLLQAYFSAKIAKATENKFVLWQYGTTEVKALLDEKTKEAGMQGLANPYGVARRSYPTSVNGMGRNMSARANRTTLANIMPNAMTPAPIQINAPQIVEEPVRNTAPSTVSGVVRMLPQRSVVRRQVA